MLVREAMTTPVVTIPRSASIRQAIHVLNEHDVTAAPVVDDTGAMVGIVSEMDLLRGEFEADPRAFLRPIAVPDEPPPARVEQVMTTQVRTVQPASDVAALAELMIKTRIKSVPVLDGEELVGIVSRRDLMAVLARGDARIRDDVLAALAGLSPQGHGWSVTVREGIVELQGQADEEAQRVAEILASTVPGVTRVLLTEPRGQ